MVFGNSGTELVNRLGNKIYEQCRNGTMSLAGFPNFQPTIDALREGSTPSTNTTYKVCVQQQSKLVVLESMASKWVNTESLKDEAVTLISEHNKKYNIDGEFWLEERTLGMSYKSVFRLFFRLDTSRLEGFKIKLMF